MNVFEAINRRVGWLGQRQRVLAQNIAHADTPDYLPRDLKQGPFGRLLMRRLAPVAQATTHADHLQAPTRPKSAHDEAKIKKAYETAPSGNAVVVEEQLVKVAETQMAYQSMTTLYRKHMQMMRMALGRNN